MAFLKKDRVFSKKWFYNYSLVIFGTFVMASGYVFFIDPHGIVPGGVYGIGIIMNNLTQGIFPHGPFGVLAKADYTGIFGQFGYYFMNYINDMFQKYEGGIPIGLTGLVINIPLTFIGIRVLGPRFGIKTITGFILCTVFIDSLTTWWGMTPLVDDVLLSCIFGGILIGFGLGLVFKARATTAGSDIIAMITAKYTKLPLGQLIIYVDSIIVLGSLLARLDWKIPLYSWIVIFVTGKVIDIILQGSSFEKALFIISDKFDEIRQKVIIDMNRGGTFIKGTGMYNGNDKTMIFTVVNRRELPILEEYIHSIDAKAFVAVMETNEILGEGFKSLKEKMDDS